MHVCTKVWAGFKQNILNIQNNSKYIKENKSFKTYIYNYLEKKKKYISLTKNMEGKRKGKFPNDKQIFFYLPK